MFSEGIVKTIIARVQADGAQEEEFLCIRYSDYSADSMLGYCRWASCLYLVLYCHSSLSFRRDKAIFSYSSWTINMYQPDKGKISTDVVEAVSAYGQSSLLISVSSCHRFMFVNKEATLGTPLKGALISWLRWVVRLSWGLTDHSGEGAALKVYKREGVLHYLRVCLRWQRSQGWSTIIRFPLVDGKFVAMPW